jgi:hypothetical protein
MRHNCNGIEDFYKTLRIIDLVVHLYLAVLITVGFLVYFT